MVSQKITNIDKEIENVNPRLIEENIVEENTNLKKLNQKLLIYGDKEIPEEIDRSLLNNKIEERDKINIEHTRNITNLKNIKNTLKNLKESEICPMCKQTLKDVDHSEEIKKLENNIEELEKIVKEEKNKIDNLYSVVKNLESKKLVFDEYEKELLKKERLVLEVNRKELELNKLTHKLNSWKENKEKLENNKKIHKEILTLDSIIDVSKNSKDNLLRDTEYSKNTIKTHTKEISEKKTKIDKIKKENEIDRIFRAYLTVYGKNGIIKTIMKSVVPKLNNELMRLLSDVTEFLVEIRVNEKNEVEFWMIDNNTQVEKLVSAGSGFERTLSALAIRTVLTKVSCLPRPNITVFDEVLGKVSNENLEQVNTFFSKVKEYFENIFLITHNPLVREWGDNIITVTKKDNVSALK